MVISRVRIMDSAVDTTKISADTVIAADIAANAVAASEISPTGFLQTGTVSVSSTSSTVIEFPSNFTSIPHVVATPLGATSGTSVSIVSVSTAAFNAILSSSCVLSWMAAIPTA